MSEFMLTEDKIPYIAKELKVDKILVTDFFPVFKEFYKTVRLQHLAHVIRALELRIREKEKNPSFRIEWKPMPNGDAIKSAVGLKWPGKYGIVIPQELVNDLKKLRVHIAHELGHLYFSALHPENNDNKELNQDMANIFGAFAMLERSDFYKEKAPLMCSENWEDVIKDFKSFCRI